AQAIPTMFPILVKGAQQQDLHRDDEVSFLRLYGSLENTCSISGKVLASDGVTEIRGVEVVAINTDPSQELSDRIAFVSGAQSARKEAFSKAQSNCLEDCGAYEISGL